MDKEPCRAIIWQCHFETDSFVLGAAEQYTQNNQTSLMICWRFSVTLQKILDKTVFL